MVICYYSNKSEVEKVETVCTFGSRFLRIGDAASPFTELVSSLIPGNHVAPLPRPPAHSAALRGDQHVSVHRPGRAEVAAHRGGARPDPQQAAHPQPAGGRQQSAVGLCATRDHAALQQHAGAAEGAHAAGRVRVRAREQRGGLLRQRGAEDRHAAPAHRLQ